MKPDKTIKDFNELFANNGISECSNCQSWEDVYDTVKWIIRWEKLRGEKIAKIEKVIKGEL